VATIRVRTTDDGTDTRHFEVTVTGATSTTKHEVTVTPRFFVLGTAVA
jgi:hypothetical protein